MSQWQLPLKHVPWPVQLPGQPPRMTVQASPKKPGSHSQLRRGGRLEHRARKASAPGLPGLRGGRRHLKRKLLPALLGRQMPWPEQFFSQRPSTTEQSSPA